MTIKLSPFLARLIGGALILAAILGLLLSVAGIYGVWRVKEPFTRQVLEGIAIAHAALTTSQEGLSLAEDALETAAESVSTMEETLRGVAAAIDDTNPIIAEAAELMSGEIPAAILATKTSLDRAQVSAQLIDTVLSTLTAIPFIPIEPYAPSIPLSQALENVSANLEQIPESLSNINANLTRTRQNFIFLRALILDLAANARTFNSSLQEAQNVVDSYQEITAGFLERLELLEERAPTWITIGAWLLTLFFVWLGIIQVGFFLQGVSMIQGEDDR